MENGWQSSADAWIADMGERGDFGRRYVLDPVMLPLIPELARPQSRDDVDALVEQLGPHPPIGDLAG